LGKKCFNAISNLVKENVFNETFKYLFYNSISSINPLALCSDFWMANIIGLFFKVTEFEWTFDFYDLPLFSFIEIDNNNKRSFSRNLDTYCSKDGKTDEHLIECPKAFITHYNVGKRINSARHIERVKIHQQEKLIKDSSADLLNGTQENAMIRLLPILKSNVNDVLDKDSFVLNNYWKNNASKYFIEIFQ
jgi:hypothetical protein